LIGSRIDGVIDLLGGVLHLVTDRFHRVSDVIDEAAGRSQATE
jgi:hypothetical protein